MGEDVSELAVAGRLEGPYVSWRRGEIRMAGGRIYSVEEPNGSGALRRIDVGDARVLPGMIFVPSVGGKSHCPQEWTDLEAIVEGTRVLARAISRLDTALDTTSPSARRNQTPR